MTSTTSTWSANPPSGRAAPGIVIGGRYALRAAIGTGGMGTVWHASDTLLRRAVAVKEVVCPPGLAPSDRDAMYERTLREARAAAALSHPSVVQVYDVVTEGGRPWIIMELLDARSLADMVLEDGPVAPRAVAKIGIALLGALEVAHAAGVLHRDVKPANVLICADGRCVLTDFGVARMPTDVQLTTPGMVLGSPHFISPERAMGGAFGPPSDLFSLGVTLYTAVEGRPPFDRGDPIETMHAVVEEPPAPPTRAGALSGVLYGLLTKDPHRRWDVAAARSVLRDLIAGPLASRARDHVTDPYAVVPSQRTPWPVVPPPPPPSGQVGGRAMINPEEPLDEAIARTRPAGGRSGLDTTDPGRSVAVDHTDAGHAAWRDSGGPWAESGTAWVQPRPGGRSHRHAVARPAGWWELTNPAGAADAARRVGHGTVTAIARWPRSARLAVGAGLAVVLLLGAAALAGRWLGDGDGSRAQIGSSQSQQPATPSPPASDFQVFRERGVEVNVPKGWQRLATKNATYVDFADPADKGRWVRINITNEKDARRLLETADRRFGGSSSDCERYQRVALGDAELAGQPGMQLEYQCTPKDQAERHGVWRVTIVGGKAYHVYLSVWEASYAASKAIFDEMVRSFKVVG